MQDLELIKSKIKIAKNKWKLDYPKGIPWKVVFMTAKHYFDNEYSHSLDCEKNLEWIGLLNYLKEIENSIPTYDYYTLGKDSHKGWLRRIFFIFGRSFLEETAAIESELGRQLRLKFRHNPENPNDICHPGPGNDKADLYSEVNGEYYEVKHGTRFDYDYIHEGHFVLAYQDGGWCILYDKNLAIRNSENKLVGGKTDIYTQTPGVRDLFAARGVPAYLYDISDESKLEEAFGFISID